MLLYRAEVHRPRQRRAAPHLRLRRELRALAHRAQAQVEHLRILLRRGPEARAAIRAERLRAAIAARGGLYVELGLAAELEAFLRHLDERHVGRAGQRLAVGAVADAGLLRVGFGLIAHLAAVAAAFDFHRSSRAN